MAEDGLTWAAWAGIYFFGCVCICGFQNQCTIIPNAYGQWTVDRLNCNNSILKPILGTDYNLKKYMLYIDD